MKKTLLFVASLVCSCTIALGQGKTLTQDPLTNLPLIPATDAGNHLGNEPVEMPKAQVCSSKMQGNFYTLYKINVGATTSWYASHLSGFNKFEGNQGKRAQIVFFNSDRTILVIITGDLGAPGQDVSAFSVAYETYQPGLPAKTVEGITQGKMVCK